MRPKLYENYYDMQLYESMKNVKEKGEPTHASGAPMSMEDFLYYSRGKATMMTCSFFLKPWKEGETDASIVNTPEFKKYSEQCDVIMKNYESVDKFIQENGKKDASPEEIAELIKNAIHHCDHNKINDKEI